VTPFIVYLAAGLLLLYLGGEGMVRGSACLGLRLGMTPLLTGLTLVAFGTSAPELVVSLQAALSGKGGLAVGNVVGSNICNIALILGLSTLIRPIEVESRLVRHDLPFMLISGLVLTVMLLDGVLSRIDSSILLLGLVAFVVFTVRRSRAPKKEVREEFGQAVSGKRLPLWLALTLMLVGLALLVWGGAPVRRRCDRCFRSPGRRTSGHWSFGSSRGYQPA
jgi:cation:H+ antiporter